MWQQIITGLVLALLDFLDKKLQEPVELKDVKTSPKLLARWSAYLRERLPKAGSGGEQPK